MNNANEPLNIPTDVKSNPRRIALEKGLYTQMVTLFRKDLIITEENRNKTEYKLKFQGQSTIFAAFV